MSFSLTELELKQVLQEPAVPYAGADATQQSEWRDSPGRLIIARPTAFVRNTRLPVYQNQSAPFVQVDLQHGDFLFASQARKGFFSIQIDFQVE